MPPPPVPAAAPPRPPRIAREKPHATTPTPTSITTTTTTSPPSPPALKPKQSTTSVRSPITASSTKRASDTPMKRASAASAAQLKQPVVPPSTQTAAPAKLASHPVRSTVTRATDMPRKTDDVHISRADATRKTDSADARAPISRKTDGSDARSSSTRAATHNASVTGTRDVAAQTPIASARPEARSKTSTPAPVAKTPTPAPSARARPVKTPTPASKTPLPASTAKTPANNAPSAKTATPAASAKTPAPALTAKNPARPSSTKPAAPPPSVRTVELTEKDAIDVARRAHTAIPAPASSTKQTTAPALTAKNLARISSTKPPAASAPPPPPARNVEHAGKDTQDARARTPAATSSTTRPTAPSPLPLPAPPEASKGGPAPSPPAPREVKDAETVASSIVGSGAPGAPSKRVVGVPSRKSTPATVHKVVKEDKHDVHDPTQATTVLRGHSVAHAPTTSAASVPVTARIGSAPKAQVGAEEPKSCSSPTAAVIKSVTTRGEGVEPKRPSKDLAVNPPPVQPVLQNSDTSQSSRRPVKTSTAVPAVGPAVAPAITAPRAGKASSKAASASLEIQQSLTSTATKRLSGDPPSKSADAVKHSALSSSAPRSSRPTTMESTMSGSDAPRPYEEAARTSNPSSKPAGSRNSPSSTLSSSLSDLKPKPTPSVAFSTVKAPSIPSAAPHQGGDGKEKGRKTFTIAPPKTTPQERTRSTRGNAISPKSPEGSTAEASPPPKQASMKPTNDAYPAAAQFALFEDDPSISSSGERPIPIFVSSRPKAVVLERLESFEDSEMLRTSWTPPTQTFSESSTETLVSPSAESPSVDDEALCKVQRNLLLDPTPHPTKADVEYKRSVSRRLLDKFSATRKAGNDRAGIAVRGLHMPLTTLQREAISRTQSTDAVTTYTRPPAFTGTPARPRAASIHGTPPPPVSSSVILALSLRAFLKTNFDFGGAQGAEDWLRGAACFHAPLTVFRALTDAFDARADGQAVVQRGVAALCWGLAGIMCGPEEDGDARHEMVRWAKDARERALTAEIREALDDARRRARNVQGRNTVIVIDEKEDAFFRPVAWLPTAGKSERMGILAFATEEARMALAQQMALVAAALWLAVDVDLTLSWWSLGEEGREKLLEGFTRERRKALKNARKVEERAVDHAMRTQWYVVQSVLRTGDKERVVDACVIWVDVAIRCFKLRNYSAGCAIYLGLTSCAIEKIFKIKDDLQTKESWVQLEELWAQCKEPKLLRSMLLSHAGPKVPALAIFGPAMIKIGGFCRHRIRQGFNGGDKDHAAYMAKFAGIGAVGRALKECRIPYTFPVIHAVKRWLADELAAVDPKFDVAMEKANELSHAIRHPGVPYRTKTFAKPRGRTMSITKQITQGIRKLSTSRTRGY